jgi:signal peptidase II
MIEKQSAAPPSFRRFGLGVVVATFLADQASKLWLLFVADIVKNGPFPVSPFFELTVVWNRGISYGLFQQGTDIGRWLLIIGSLVAAMWMGVLMWRSTSRILAASLALVVGGALGNAVDRVAYQAVFDFAHFFIGEWSWYVFNIADAAIVVGVIGLLYDTVMCERRASAGRQA